MTTKRLFALSLLSITLSGCGGPSDFKPADGMSAADIYYQACEACHGENGVGKFGFLFAVAGTEAPVEDIAALLKEGGHIMPSFPQMSDEQRLMMAGYIKGL